MGECIYKEMGQLPLTLSALSLQASKSDNVPGPEWETCSRKCRWPTELLCDAACLHEGRTPGRKKPVSRRKPGRAAHAGSLNLSHPDCLEAVALPQVSPIHVQLTTVDMRVFPAELTVVPQNSSGKNCLRLCYS